MQDLPGRHIRTLFLLALALLIGACSSLRLSYDYGDTLLYWWLDSYVDVDSGQKAALKRDIDKLFQWHRKSQLKDYVQLLKLGQQQLQGNVTQADVLADYNAVMSRASLLLFKAEPELADLARSLRPEQLLQMEKKFASNNDDFRKKYLRGDVEKRRKLHFQKSMEQFELWFGSFSREQEESIRQASDARPLDDNIWLDERVRRQKNIMALLQKVQLDKTGKEATMLLIHDLITDSFEPPQNSEHKALLDAHANATAQLIFSVTRIATAAQIAHARKRMQGWIDDFGKLAADARADAR